MSGEEAHLTTLQACDVRPGMVTIDGVVLKVTFSMPHVIVMHHSAAYVLHLTDTVIVLGLVTHDDFHRICDAITVEDLLRAPVASEPAHPRPE